jgi:hypothetical protein
LKVYQISEAELELLERGPDGQLQLNFAAALLPTGLSLVLTLQTAEFSPKWFMTYTSLAGVFIVIGLIQFAQFLRLKSSHAELLQEIRLRMPDMAESDEEVGESIGPGLPLKPNDPEMTDTGDAK